MYLKIKKKIQKIAEGTGDLIVIKVLIKNLKKFAKG